MNIQIILQNAIHNEHVRNELVKKITGQINGMEEFLADPSYSIRHLQYLDLSDPRQFKLMDMSILNNEKRIRDTPNNLKNYKEYLEILNYYE